MKQSIITFWGIQIFFFFFAHSLAAQPTAIFKVFFDRNQDQLSISELETILDKTADLSNPVIYRVQLIGHTDSRGSLDYNQALSERRAESVKSALMDLGFLSTKIEVKGMAFLDPQSNEETEVNEALNRRVEIIIEKSDWNVESTYYSVPIHKPATIIYERSGTEILIPKDAFSYPDGSPFEGEAIVQYREFRDPADFIASDIPMQLEYEGEPAYFSSTGMFEIKAYDDEGNQLQLNSGKQLDINFVQTNIQEGTKFWRFDEASQTWEEGAETVTYLNADTNQLLVETTTDTVTGLKLDWGKNQKLLTQKGGVLHQLDAAYSMIPDFLDGMEYFNRPRERIDYFALGDYRLFDQRFANKHYAGVNYVGNLKPYKIRSIEQYTNLRFRVIKSRSGYRYFRIMDLTGENNELEPFTGQLWKISRSQLARMRRNVRGARFQDIRIKQSGVSKNKFKLSIKTNEKTTTYTVKLADSDFEETESQIAQSKFLEYERLLDERRRIFNEKTLMYESGSSVLWNVVKLLISKDVSNDPSKAYALRAAIDVDQDNPVTTYYRGNRKLVKKHGTYIKAYYYLTEFGDIVKEELTAQANPDWNALIDTYPSTVFYTQDRFVNSITPFNKTVPSLRIANMGVFNCDVIYRYQESERLFVQFKDEQGADVDFHKVEIVNHDLNGVLAFGNPDIFIDLKARNTILVYTKDDRILYIPSKRLADLPLKNKGMVELTLQDPGALKGSPEELRQLFESD